jgi:hypothetical protein
VDIRVEAVTPVGSLSGKTATPTGLIEAKVLAVRPPRRRSASPPAGRVDQRRHQGPAQDPPGARVLVLLIPEGTQVPEDLETGSYRTFVRFTKR